MRQLLAKLGGKALLILITVALFLGFHSRYLAELLNRLALVGGFWFDRETCQIVLAGVLLSACLVTIQTLWRPFLSDSRSVKNVLLVGLAFNAFALVFLLPPFQGPDEPAHWKTALKYCRADPTAEIPLYNLNQILGTARLQFRPHEHLDPKVLRTQPAAQAPQHINKVDYTHPLSYPVVSLVSLFFPKVETLNEALLFYYLCRAVPVALLLVMLFVANQKDLLPYTALFFFSTPYVLQQFSVVSADTLGNLGTMLALLLFLVLWRAERRSVWLMVLLWVVCLAVVSAKPPIYAGIFLLPLALLPVQRIPYKPIVLPVAAGVLFAACYLAVRWGLDLLRTGADPQFTDIDQKLELLGTQAGFETFFNASLKITGSMFDFKNYCQPLGWVDTELSPHHLSLLYAAAVVALLFDLSHYGPGLLIISKERKGTAVVVGGIVLINTLILLATLCFVGFIAWSPHGSMQIYGVQTRYVFPGVMVLLFVPLAAFAAPDPGNDQPEPPGFLALVNHSSALGFMILLLFARAAELTIDLLIRYW